MKKLFVLSLIITSLVACDKSYVCNCATTQGGLPYKKVYLIAKTDGGAERQCKKNEESGESCLLQE